jgi:NADPH:quinone reductase-like Zn-dependent oxidoreductase
LPIVPGSDTAGVVEAVGAGVRGIAVGEEVVTNPGFSLEPSPEKLTGYDPLCADFGILGAHRDGGCAEYVAVPAENVLRKPESLSFVETAAVPIVFQTAWHMLVVRARLVAGETVLIQAAGSGVSHAAIQIARLIGARVIATSSTDEKLTRAAELGADATINYRTEDVAARVRKLTDGRGADVVLDHCGAATWKADTAALAKGGRLVLCGATTGAEVTLNLGPLFYLGQSVLGSTLGTREELQRVLTLMDQGKLEPIVDTTFALNDIRAAHEYMADPDRFGKVVITV